MLNFENVRNIVFLDNPFCEMAKDYFCEQYNINVYPQSFNTIKQVTEYAAETPDCLAVLPIENSVEGTVRETFDNLLASINPNIKILAEYCLPINYCLLARTTEIYSITGIIAPPNVLAKCSEFIRNEMPYNSNIIEASSISDSARSLQNYNLTVASIGCKKTAENFNLNILKENISDDKNNHTRFVLIGDFEVAGKDSDTTSIAFATANKPGALLNVLNIFMQNQINMSYIASYSSKKKFDEYVFIVNLDGNLRSPKMLTTLKEVKENTTFMRYLGSYKRSYSSSAITNATALDLS